VKIKKSLATIATIATMLIFSPSAHAGKCNTGAFNPITDVVWNAITPIKIGGLPIVRGSGIEASGAAGTPSPVCVTCKDKQGAPFIGLTVSFSDISDMVEVVQTPGCSTVLGTNFGFGGQGYMGGTSGQTEGSAMTFKQTHWIHFPLFGILNLMRDIQCIAPGDDIIFGDPSELDPTHQSDLLAMGMDPWCFLYAAPPFTLVEPANIALAHLPVSTMPPAYNAMEWMWWGNICPLSGNVASPRDMTSSAQIAAKQLRKRARVGLIQGRVTNQCTGTIEPFPKKDEWRFSLAKPKKTPRHFIAGQTELIWGTNKNPPFREGNFLFLLYQKKVCCEKLL